MFPGEYSTPMSLPPTGSLKRGVRYRGAPPYFVVSTKTRLLLATPSLNRAVGQLDLLFLLPFARKHPLAQRAHC
jgi:hypothetical protein